MRVLIGCEFSGRVRDAIIKRGHYAVSCDKYRDSETPGPHRRCDVRSLLDLSWDAFICFPDCTFLCSSGLWRNRYDRTRDAKTRAALAFVNELLNCDVPKIALENPIGCISTQIRLPDQIIQPHHFGEDASKATCLWLKNLPLLISTKYVKPRIVDGRKRWANQTDSGQNRLSPSEHRAADRSRTYPGIADAMAKQWF